MSSKSVLQERQERVSTRLSRQNVNLAERCVIVSSKGVLQECHPVCQVRVSHKWARWKMWQISIVSVPQHTCRHSGSWVSSCFLSLYAYMIISQAVSVYIDPRSYHTDLLYVSNPSTARKTGQWSSDQQIMGSRKTKRKHKRRRMRRTRTRRRRRTPLKNSWTVSLWPPLLSSPGRCKKRCKPYSNQATLPAAGSSASPGKRRWWHHSWKWGRSAWRASAS